jgi:hypothetical protein
LGDGHVLSQVASLQKSNLRIGPLGGADECGTVEIVYMEAIRVPQSNQHRQVHGSGKKMAKITSVTKACATVMLFSCHNVTAGEQTCDAIGDLNSKPGATPTTLAVANHSSVPIWIQWKGYNGEFLDYGMLAGGEKRNQATYATHVWVARDTAGRCLSLFVSESTLENWNIWNSNSQLRL